MTPLIPRSGRAAPRPPAPGSTAVPPSPLYGWGISMPGTTAHYVPAGTPIINHKGRPLGFGLDHFPAYVDPDGLTAAVLVEQCLACRHALHINLCVCADGVMEHADTTELGVIAISRRPCHLCGGSGVLPPQPQARL